jgi:hypothetical protein
MAAKSSRPPRTLSDIKTVAGKSSDRDKRSYANYFQMGALELERWRREQERQAASERVAEIDRRLSDIDSEMRSLQADLQPHAAPPKRAGQRAGSAERVSVTTTQYNERPAGERRGLRLKY